MIMSQVSVATILKAFNKVLAKLTAHQKNMELKVKQVDTEVLVLGLKRKKFVSEKEKATRVIEGFKKLTGET